MTKMLTKIIVLLLFLFTGCSDKVPIIEESLESDFSIKEPNSKPIVTISIISYKNDAYIWNIEPYDWGEIHFKTDLFNIGEIPPQMKQLLPKDNQKPRKIKEDEEVLVCIEYIHDHFFAAGSGNDIALFKKIDGRLQLTKHINPVDFSSPVWESENKRNEGIKSLNEEINKGQSLFLKTANNPNASPNARNTVKVLMEYAKKDNPVEAYIYLRQLKDMRLEEKNLSDMSVFRDFDQLEWLGLGSNKIKDVSPLKALPKLISLNLDNNPIDDFTPIGEIPSLRFLDISNTGVKGFKFLSECKTLNLLTVKNNNLTDSVDLSVLSHLEITHFNISYNLLETGECIKALQGLDELEIECNKLNSLDFIQFTPILRLVNLSFNELEDITPLIEHYKDLNKKDISRVYLYNNKLMPKKQIRKLKKYTSVISGFIDPVPKRINEFRQQQYRD